MWRESEGYKSCEIVGGSYFSLLPSDALRRSSCQPEPVVRYQPRQITTDCNLWHPIAAQQLDLNLGICISDKISILDLSRNCGNAHVVWFGYVPKIFRRCVYGG
ncbi:hypothetical protein AVEN_109095-1 [Araneus ventricosus]|uniref:Uncharacterized protein n=1 Tax=Araneus ventricosus TaxID=182803 RepID=A0A4Y2IB37_ARAVE|nr:hypothetical protein AVEN_109095-1 [Araneus ventricosus]